MKSWFSGTASAVNAEIIAPFSNAEQIIYKYNQAVEHNSLTQQGWQRLIAQCDDGLASYLTNIKGSTASMSAYSVSLQGSITGYTKITTAMKQYNALGAVSQKEQQNFATAVALTNTKLGSYLTGLNGAKASLSGYGISLIASTAKTVGLTIATTALNAALTFGISAIVTGVISAFATWINSSKKITEAAEEAKDKISSINDDLKTNTETVENAKQRYAELAQEVENLGKVSQGQGSLSTDEYKEFLDLSNQLAGVFPQLTKGYDDNGNAILDLSGSVDTIVGSLDDLLQKEKDLANQKIMDEFPDVYKGYIKDLGEAQSEVKSAKAEFDKVNNAYQQLQNSGGAAQAFDLQGNGTFENADGEQVKVTLAEYEQALKDLGIEYEKTNIMVKNQFGGDTLSGYLINATGDIDTAFTNKLETAKKNLDYAKQQLEGETSSISSYLNTWLQTEFTYNQIDDAGLQTAVQDMIMNFDFSNLPENVDEDNWNEVSEYLRRNILFAINDVQDDPDISNAISEVFTNQDLTPDEKADYLKQIKDYFDNELGKDNAISIALQPQIDDTEALQKSYDAAINRFKSDTSDSSSKELDSLNKQLDEQTQSLADAKENLQNEYDKISDWGLDDYADQIKNNTIQTKFGNVDMDKRTIIHWSDELKHTYADALASWDYDPEIGSIDTVFGGSERFGEELNGNGWEVAFTPILPDGTFLSKDTVEEYINSILEEAYADDGKVTEDELTAIDAQGRQVGNTFVQGIFAGIDDSQNYDGNGNWAETVGRLMHFVGSFGAKQLADQGIDSANKKLEETKKKIEEVSKGFDDSQKIKDFFNTKGINTDEEINEFNEITKGITDADLAIQTWNEHVSETATQSKTFESVWTSTSEEVKKKLLELAKSGEITPETISSTEEYKTLIDGTGESAESAKNKILNMLSATEKLSGASKGLSSLKTAYQEFADENNGKGFVTASTLESLPEVFKNLPHYDLFEQIVGDPNSGKEKIQSAFNDIAKDYLINQQTLMGVTQENMATYIANLKEMGIQNADEIVQNFVQAQNQQSQLLNEAESEYNNYLQTKDQADLEYLESSSSKNGQLVSALGSAYQGDYANWCNLLTTKAQAYNKFINAIKGSQASLINNTPFQSGTKQAQAIINDVKNHNGRTGGGTSLSLSNTNGLKGLGGTLMSSSAASPSQYTKEQYDAAKSYMDQVNQYNQLKSQLKLDLTNITTNFGGGYSFKPSSSGKSGGSGSKGGGSGSEKEPTKKDYDWIETLISRINRQVSNLGKTVSATYKTWSTRNNALTQELSAVNSEIDVQYKAYQKYIDLANSVGLSEDYASLVRNGSLDVSTIADDDLNEQISQYKQYYEAALDCADTIQDLNDKVAELAKSKFDNISSEYESQLKQIEHSTNIYQSYIDQVEAEDKIPLRSYYEQLIKNENSNINKLKEEYFVLTKAMNEAIAAGKIEKYSEDWYSMQEAVDSVSESIQDANKSLIEYTKSMKELAKTRFDKIATSFDNPGDLIDHSQTYYNNFIDEAEAEGHLASKDYYKALINLENLNLSNLVKESDELNKSLNEALKSGDVEKYSDTWYDMVGKINDVDEAIQDANKSLIEYGNNMRQIEWDLFDKTEDYISKLQDESDFIIDLLSNNELYDENTGNDTKYATALKGLHAVNYNVYMAQADEYAKEIKKLNSEIAKDPSNSTLLERRQELLKAQQDAISGAEDEKQSIKDLVSNGYDKMLDALQKLIDKRKEVLDAEKSLYDYEKSISEKTENLANLRKQWSALQGDNSEEAKTKRQQLETSIKDVESDLQDTEYQQYISDQEKLFDNFYDQTETWLNERLDNLDGIINDVIESTNANAYDISQTISEATSDVGYTLSDEMSRIWDHDDIDSINRTTSGIGSVVSIYGDDFSNRLTTTNTTIDGIKTLVQSLVDDSAKRKAAEDAAEEAAKATQASAQQAKQTSTSTTPSTSTTTKTTTSTTSNKSSSSNSNNSNNSSSGWGSWFVHKTDSFPKSKLDISNSIVDRLKYRDIDSAFNKRKDYYYAMGGTGTYKGSASQNTWMISQMKAHGFKKGGTIGSAIKQTGEDGYILARTGEEVLSLEKLEMLKEALKYTSNISYPNVSSPTIPNFANASQSINSNLDVGGVNIVMNGVNDMQAFSKQMRTALADDVKTQKMIKSMLWNNGMDYKKFK